MQDDQWSAHETVESEDEQEVMEETVNHEEDLTIRAGKLSAATDKTHEVVESPSPTVPSPTAAQDAQRHEADAGSVHSLPVVQVTEHSSLNEPMTSRSASSSYPVPPSTGLTPTATSSLDRRNRLQSTMDVSNEYKDAVNQR